MIPSSHLFDQSTISALLEHDPLVQDYRAFFALFDWSVVDDWQAQHSARGRPPHPESAYLKAFLIRQKEGFTYTSQLRRFLRHRIPCSSSSLASISCLIPAPPTALLLSRPFLAAIGSPRNCACWITACYKRSCTLPCRPCKPKSRAWVRRWL